MQEIGEAAQQEETLKPAKKKTKVADPAEE